MTRSAEALLERPTHDCVSVLPKHSGYKPAETTALKSPREVLIERMHAFKPDKTFPLWTKEFSAHLKTLDDARAIYERVFISFLPENRSGYDFETQIKHREILKEFPEFQDSAPSDSPEDSEEQEEPLDPSVNLDALKEYLVLGRKSHSLLLDYAQNWIRRYLRKARVVFTPEIEEFALKSSVDTIKVLKQEDVKSNFFPEVVKERIKKRLQESELKISFVNIEPGTYQEVVYILKISGYSLEEISELSKVPFKNIASAYKALQAKGIFPKYTSEEVSKLSSIRLGKLRKNNTFNSKARAKMTDIYVSKEYKEKQRKAHIGQGHSFDSRVKMSEQRGGSMKEILELANLGLNPWLIAEILGMRSKKTISSIYRLREKKDIKPTTDRDRIETSATSRKERTLDSKIRKLFVDKKTKYFSKGLPIAQEITINLINKLYPVDLLSLEQKEALVERVARSVLESYQPNENSGFHTQTVVWISQNLPQSLIYGKINREIASSAPIGASSQ